MESALFSTVPLLAFSKTLKLSPKPFIGRRIPHPLPHNPARLAAGGLRCFKNLDSRTSRELSLTSFAGHLLRGSLSPSPSVSRCRLACISSSAALSGSGGDGGGGDGIKGGGDGGGGSPGGGSNSAASVSTENGNTASRASDAIILDVGGMSCGGCAASVKRILESQPQVYSANVNLATETAIVWAVPEVKASENWKQDLGIKLAGHLTTCGFKSSLRDFARDSLYRAFEKKMDEKLLKLKESGRELAVSWALCAVCLVGHISHFLGANVPTWMHALHSTSFHLSLSLFTFLGPGRKLVLDGFRSLIMRSPNMNTLVGLGALSSFAVSCIAALMPKLDRIPADGTIKAGRSTVDESSFTGEPMPVVKLPGAEVTAGSINLNGTLTIEVKRPGGETAMGDIVRLVEDAQTRQAPVQRLADKVAGHFTYGVMALSAATFTFWSLFGGQIVPAALMHASPISLALQLSCSVLVVACPCALGLATPTAVLVGTSLGATRGLLLRGGDVLEKFAGINTVVFDKTGTLTIGKPVVTKVMVSQVAEDDTKKLNVQEADILRLAAGVESNTNHPIGKAITEAARFAHCNNAKAADGSFIEEPGSGATAIVDQKKVTVGTLSWLRRHGVLGDPFPDAELDNQSFVYVGIDSDLAGLIYFQDKIREDAYEVVDTLSKQGIDIYMLSGDKKHTAEYVASMVGIPKNKVLSEVKPKEKKKFISDLQKDQKKVAMVGDGINDAAALASADIGIAMGEGVGAASDVSSVVLLHNRLLQLTDALDLSKLTMKTVKQNLWWAFAYNIVGIPIAAGILLPLTGTMLTPSIAGALMGLSSVGVMTNSLLLKIRLEGKQKSATNKRQIESRDHAVSDVIVQVDNRDEKSYRAKWRNT